jgi:predicted molibdopterin-dependent oxidoreductase YjgC
MFRPAFESAMPAVRFTFEGRPMTAREGDTVAAALLANGIETFRSSVISSAPRGPYCLMGVCFECLVMIDGVGNRQACLVIVRDGMAIQMQHGRRSFSMTDAAE